jgi:hypothetical protein
MMSSVLLVSMPSATVHSCMRLPSSMMLSVMACKCGLSAMAVTRDWSIFSSVNGKRVSCWKVANPVPKSSIDRPMPASRKRAAIPMASVRLSEMAVSVISKVM